ncbi:MAG: hypothetical protein PUP91_17145 [Rhizonema sp. PD37]|nr:hypothetical protein [Rhizonema sp. PD37]
MTILASAKEDENSFSFPDLLKTFGLDRLETLIQRVTQLVEKGVPPAGLAMALQIWYRTLSGNQFNESIESVTKRANFSRNYALRGLAILQQLNIITRTKRHGFSDEYEFTDCSLWEKYAPPIPNKDTLESRGDLIQFPTENNSEPVETEPIPDRDDPVEDTNVVIVPKLIEKKETTTKVNNPVKDTPKNTRWRYNGNGIGRLYQPDKVDDETGMMIERLHKETLRSRPNIIKDGVKLLFDSVLGKAKSSIPQPILDALQEISVTINDTITKLFGEYGEDKFMSAISYQKTQRVDDPNRYFVKCLKGGWGVGSEKVAIPLRTESRLTDEQQKWYAWACATGICLNVLERNLPEKMGQIAVQIPIKDRRLNDPPYDLVVIDVAMREYPIGEVE